MSEIIECDSFAMTAYKNCARFYDLRINQGLVSKGRAGGGRGFGGVMHSAREAWRKALMSGVTESAALMCGIAALHTEYAIAFPPGIEVKEGRSLANAEILFRGYTAKFIRHNYRPISVETPFSVDAGITPAGRVVKRTGIMDEYCEFNNRKYALDLKTSSVYPGGTWMDAWRTSEQFLGYVFAAQQIYGECDGTIVHGIWVHPQPKTARNKYKPEDYFTAEIIAFSAGQISEWHQDFLASIDRREEARARGEWSPNLGNACKTVFGLCSYHKWCSSTPEIRPQVEQIYYERQMWQPLEADRLGAVTQIGPVVP